MPKEGEDSHGISLLNRQTLFLQKTCRKCSSHAPPSPTPGSHYKSLTLVRWFAVLDEPTLTIAVTWSPYIGIAWSLGDLLWVWTNTNDMYVIMWCCTEQFHCPTCASVRPPP